MRGGSAWEGSISSAWGGIISGNVTCKQENMRWRVVLNRK